MREKILYYFIYFYAYSHALLPFRMLYILSDIFFFFVFYILKYRRKLVYNNIKNAFPEKPQYELKIIEKAFYHHFCDYIFETVKLLHISDEEMKKRMKFVNIEQFQEMVKDNQSCVFLMGHYGNWEWVTSITLWVSNKIGFIGQIYRPLKNKSFDKFLLRLRKRFHSVGIPKNETLRRIVQLRRDKTSFLIGFMSDQKPSVNNIHYWTTFLNQETSVLTGAERIAKQTNSLVAFLDVKKIKRGYYEGEIKIITDDPCNTETYHITEQYTRMMENSILKNPAYWLWTHNRWKYKKKDLT